jgi:hypothetical protein
MLGLCQKGLPAEALLAEKDTVDLSMLAGSGD